ncbi:MAG: lysophospholipid acyltransferase family protein [Terracidiphilus sp.]
MIRRRCRRAVALAFTILGCILRAGLKRLRGPLTPIERAKWLRRSAQKVLAAAGIEWRVMGAPPARGLVVSNHLSYLDVAALAAAMPCAFVSKIEVSRWPVFGLLARLAGSIFIDRGSRASAEGVALEIAGRLSSAVPILVFPEGTSSDGTQVLRFHSRLFEPAVAAGAPITAAAVGYAADCELPEPELCWFGDEPFLPNLWKILRVECLCAQVVFGESRSYPNREAAARETRAEVEAIRAFHQGAGHAEVREAVTLL